MMRSPGEWERLQLQAIPEPWRARVAGLYRRKLEAAELPPFRVGEPWPVSPERFREAMAAPALAAGWLSSTAAEMRRLRVPVGLSDAELIERAESCARQAWALAEYAPGHFLTVEQLRERLGGFVASFGINPPGEKIENGPAIARMTSPQWWRRALRVSQARELERAGIALGYVHKNAEIYATDATVERRRQQRRRNAATLEGTKATNTDTGQEYTLAQLAALSVANPAIRRGELMARINGFESVARGLGHVAEFVTLTCPSRFHRMRKAGPRVEENPKHTGETPRQAHKYLVALWARLRAKLARMGLRVYGFRIAEPHHDATPHWHLLLFMPEWLRQGARAVPRFRAVFRRYALKDSPEENGAKKYRCKFEAIDWSRGTAAGYVAKYVSKNIDGGGYQVQGDIEGNMEAITPSHRVEAWASTWGIRQFQQIGGPPVGVWRELRRMDEQPGAETLEAARSAADVGNWARFVEVMGGPVVPRRAMPLRVAYDLEEIRFTQYGDKAAPRVLGVSYRALEPLGMCVRQVVRVAESRRYQWEIKKGGYGNGKHESCAKSAGETAAAVFNGVGVGEGKEYFSRNAEQDFCNVGSGKQAGTLLDSEAEKRAANSALRSGKASGVVGGFKVLGRDSAPRTRVNNCTGQIKTTVYASPLQKKSIAEAAAAAEAAALAQVAAELRAGESGPAKKPDLWAIYWGKNGPY